MYHSRGVGSLALAASLCRLNSVNQAFGSRTRVNNVFFKSRIQYGHEFRNIHTHYPLLSTTCVKNLRQSAVEFQIIPSKAYTQIKCETVARSNIETNDLQLTLNGQDLRFNLTWLRDSCHCSTCTHQFSRQRLLNPKVFNKDMFMIKSATLLSSASVPGPNTWPGQDDNDTAALKFQWNDGHESVYLLGWLSYVNSLYKEPKIELNGSFGTFHAFPADDFYNKSINNTANLKLWNVADIKKQLEPVSYQSLIHDFVSNVEDPNFINSNNIEAMSERRFSAMLSITRQLNEFGLSKIVDVPQERNQVLEVARSLAYVRATGYGTLFDVVVEPSEDINLAYSSLEFDLHSDLTYREISPGVQLLHCIQNSVEGGFSYFSDAFMAAKQLRQMEPKLFEVLVKFPCSYVVRDPYRNIKFRRHLPMINLDFEGELQDVYYTPFMLPPVGHTDDIKLFYLAYDKFTGLLQSSDNKLVDKMKPGDLYIFHNRRVLHGRSAYQLSNTTRRFLQGCYMDWDEISSLHEKLHRHMIERKH